jgi:hypothetical protein
VSFPSIARSSYPQPPNHTPPHPQTHSCMSARYKQPNPPLSAHHTDQTTPHSDPPSQRRRTSHCRPNPNTRISRPPHACTRCGGAANLYLDSAWGKSRGNDPAWDPIVPFIPSPLSRPRTPHSLGQWVCPEGVGWEPRAMKTKRTLLYCIG